MNLEAQNVTSHLTYARTGRRIFQVERSQIPELYTKVVRSQNSFTLATYVIGHQLPKNIKRVLDEAFTGPIGLGYQDPIGLLYVAKLITAKAISVVKRSASSSPRPFPGTFERIHHNHDGQDTARIIGIIQDRYPSFTWATDVNDFDGLVELGNKERIYVELGWVLPHKVRDLLYTDAVELLIFPYQRNCHHLAPYYFVAARGPKWQRLVDNELKERNRQYEQCFPE